MNIIIIKIPQYLLQIVNYAKILAKLSKVPDIEIKSEYNYLTMQLLISIKHPNLKESKTIKLITNITNDQLEEIIKEVTNG